MTADDLQNTHVFMVSFPGQGHVNPILRLGKRLAGFGLFVTVCTPEFAGNSIKQVNKINDDYQIEMGRGKIRFEFFDDGWDLTSPNRNQLDAYLAQLELVGRKKLPEMIRKHEEMGRPVKCLINNPFIPWISDVAEELGIPSAMLWVQSCACYSVYYHYYNKLRDFPTSENPEIDVEIPCLPPLKYDEIPSFLLPNSPYPFLASAILGQFKNMKKPFCVLMDTFQELEPEIVDYMSKICRPIKTIGPLFKDLNSKDMEINRKQSEIRADFFTPDDCLSWLDSQPHRSVVYISFGSVVQLKQEQIDELAHGLLISGLSFLWVLRPPPKESIAPPSVLSEGFLEKAGEKGKIVQWSPQTEVLAHPSTACFVSHCGWNSTMEALTCGVPVVAFPQWGDQVTDAKFLVDVFKVGIRMSRGEDDSRIIISREEVAECLTAATVGKVAAEMQENALKWKKAAEAAVAEGGSSFRNAEEFVQEILRLAVK